jgi:hypothetical protein
MNKLFGTSLELEMQGGGTVEIVVSEADFGDRGMKQAEFVTSGPIPGITDE